MSEQEKAVAEQIKIIQEKIMNDKTNIIKIVDFLKESLDNSKELQSKNPKKAFILVNDVITHLFILEQVFSVLNSKQELEYWNNNKNLLISKSNLLKSSIENQIKLSEISKKERLPFADLWSDDTMQESFHLETFRKVALPCIHPDLYMKYRKTIIIEGDKNTGKSYTLNKIRQLLEEQHIPSEFYNVSSIDFENKIDSLIPMIIEKKDINLFFVTELPPFDMMVNWTTQNMTKWYLLLEKDVNITWIILCRNKKQISDDVLKLLKPDIIQYRLPTSKTIYNFINNKIKKIYNLDEKELESYINLPILEEELELVKLSNILEKKNYNFDQIIELIQNGLKNNLNLAVRENSVYHIDNKYYLKNSIKLPLHENYSYSLIHENDKLQISLITPTETENYFSVDILDTLESVEDDRMSGIWVKNHTEDLMDVIASFDVNIYKHPYHLNNNTNYLYRTILYLYISMLKNIKQANVNSSHPFYSFLNNILHNRYDIHSIYSIDSLFLLDKYTSDVLFFDKVKHPLIYKAGFVDEVNNFCSSSVQYIVYNDEKNEESLDDVVLNLSSGKKTIEMNVNWDADRLQEEILNNFGLKNYVTKTKSARGYMWCVVFEENVDKMLISYSGNDDIYVSIFCGLEMIDEFRLSEDYCVTNEGDLDLLVEKYPNDFKECDRDVESTWKLHKLEKHHIDMLNGEYNNEQKFYLMLYLNCLKLKNPLFNDNQMSELLELLNNLRNHIDFLMMLVPSTDNDDENGMWSVSDNNPLKEDMESRFYSMNKRLKFNVNPYYLTELLYLFSKDIHNNLVELRNIYDDCQGFYKQPEVNKHTIYIKSSITKDEWKKSCGMSFDFMENINMLTDRFINHGIYEYVKNYKKTLYYKLFKNVTQLGMVEKMETNLVNKEKIIWFDLKNDDNLNKLINSFKGKHYLLDYNNLDDVPYLLALMTSCMLDDIEKHKSFIASLLYIPFFYTNRDVLKNLLHFVESSEKVFDFMSYFNIESEGLNLFVLNRNLNSGIPSKIDREKSILSKEEINSIREIYGLRASHLESQLVDRDNLL